MIKRGAIVLWRLLNPYFINEWLKNTLYSSRLDFDGFGIPFEFDEGRFDLGHVVVVNVPCLDAHFDI